MQLYVGKNNRVTFPKEMGLTEGTILECIVNKDGSFTFNQVSKVSPNLYAVPIGESQVDGKWYGIVISEDGAILARVRSSDSQYLKKDLMNLELKHTEKLNKAYGNTWKTPVYTTNFNDLKGYAKDILNEKRKGLEDETWPPYSTRMNSNLESSRRIDEDF